MELPSIPTHHHYFAGDTVKELRAQLTDDAILRVWTEGHQMFLYVETPGAKVAPIRPLNDSHVCPGSPGCPHG